MPDKKPEWSDYAYDDDSISKRLDINKEDVKKLKSEAAEKSKQTKEGVPSPDIGIGLGVSIDTNDPKNSGLRVGLKMPGLGIEYDTNGEGSIDIVNLIKIETIRIKCFYIQRFYFAGQFLYSDIQKVDSEECNKEPPEPPEPNDDENLKPMPEPWPPKPKGGSKDKFTQILVCVDKQVRGISIESENGINYRNNTTNRLTITNVDRKNQTCSYVNSSTKTSGQVQFYVGHFTRLLYIHAAQESVTETWLVGGGGDIRLVNGSELAINNYLDTLEYGQISIISIFGNISKSYGSSFGYNPERGFVSNTYNPTFGAPNEFPDYVYYLENSIRISAGQIIFINDVGENPTKNPPLQPEMEKECCDKLEKLLKKLAKYQGLGQSVKPINVKDNKIEEKGGDDIFPLKVPKRWIDRESEPKDDYEIKNMRHLILSIGIMIDRFEELFNPAGKDNGFPLKKPEEGLWKWLPGDGGDYEAPDPDFDPKKSKEDGKIKSKKLKIETYLDLFRYFLESQIRLEMLFPIAQIRDSKISKRLIYPKAPGEIQINDLIQFQELMFLFINKTLGDPASAVIIKDADPTQEGAQPVTIENFDISDMLRKLIRFSVDINSDIDLTNNFSKRTLYQLLSAMQVLVKNHEMTEAIFEDLGMKEEQVFVPVKFFADLYAGAWKAGEGFDPKKVKMENTEAEIEANLQAFLQEKEVDVKVSRRAKDETPFVGRG